MNRIIKILTTVLVVFQFSLFSKEIILKAGDTGKHIELEIGDTLKIVLNGNPTTGYTWNLVSFNKQELPLIDKTYKSSNNLCGAGGTYSFKFSAVSKGTSTLLLINSRSWEKETLPINSFESTIEIK